MVHKITEQNDKAFADRLKSLATVTAARADGRAALVDFALFALANHDKPHGKAAEALINWFGGLTLGNLPDIQDLDDDGYRLFLAALSWYRESGDAIFVSQICAQLGGRITDKEYEIKNFIKI